jgi:rubrerythrin
VDELEKLKILLHHWMEHNNEHAEIYRDWAKKAMILGNKEVSKIFELLYYETERLNRLVEKAIEKLDEPNKLSRSEIKSRRLYIS